MVYFIWYIGKKKTEAVTLNVEHIQDIVCLKITKFVLSFVNATTY